MKAIILAAGGGKRLGRLKPKPLTPIRRGKTILDQQIENLLEFIPIHNILVVVGYKKEIIIAEHPELAYVYNDAYAKTNTGKSLLIGLNKMEKSDDVLWLNGDVVFDKRIINKFINRKKSSILVDNKKCGKEEVKYNTDSSDYIKKISKNVRKGEGEALGINLVKSKDLAIFKKHLNLIDNQDYFEKGIENMITQDKVKISPVNVGKLFCHEIDFPEDLEVVKKYLVKHNVC